MASNDLFDYMRDATHAMQSEYERIQKRAVEDPGTAGDNGEENWADLLRKWLPSTYHIVTKGRIMNTKGQCSPQVDVLVLSPAYPEALLEKKEYLEGGVIAAFECKLTLKAKHIREAVKNAAKIRRLSLPIRYGTPYKELHTRMRYGLLTHSHVWQGEQSNPIETIEDHLYDAEMDEIKHPKEVLDVICVSDLATWGTLKVLSPVQSLLSKRSSIYNQQGNLLYEIQQSDGAIETTHICFADEFQTSDKKKQLFTPIGSFLATFLYMLAWEDTSLRSLAEYFILADLIGFGGGKTNFWPLTVLSDKLVARLKRGGCLVTGERWHEWSYFFKKIQKSRINTDFIGHRLRRFKYAISKDSIAGKFIGSRKCSAPTLRSPVSYSIYSGRARGTQ